MQTHGYEDVDQETRADAQVTGHDALDSGERKAPFERGEKLGRYVVLGRLGVGGMGVVLSAYDTTLDRRVALKLLHEHTSNDPENHARLLREAQALAKLSHPHVVSVYDVGELRGRVFISMEFIDGPNLRQWLSLEQRTVANILAVFRGAGKGLLAAHDAGIVHRDFKPDNVLIGADGEAHVTDFGLALEANVPLPDSARGSSSHSASARLTQTGAIMGTPAYMPIEQHAGLPTDHRSDQFSFCVSLFEALHGVRPFAGANAHELCLAIGRARLPASPASVPRRIRRALARGLSPKAEHRFPSMRALLRAIAPPTRKSRTWILGGVAGLTAGAALVGLIDPAPPRCTVAGDRVETVYGPEQRRMLRSAFTATQIPYAQTSLAATEGALDAFAARWAKSAENACRQSERGAQSGEMLDLRMLCLDRGLGALSATLEVLSELDPDGVRESVKIVEQLPDLSLCEDLEALPRLAILPATTAQAQDAKTLLPLIDRISTYIIADRLDEAQALLDTHAEDFARSTYPLVVILHQTWGGRLLLDRHDDRALEVVEAAHLLALEHGLYEQASRTANSAATIHAQQAQLEPAMRWLESAAALARAAGSTRLEATAATNSSSFYSDAGRHDEAVAQSQRALDLVEDDADYPPRGRVELLLSHAETLQRRDGGDAGDAQVREARTLIGQLDSDAPVITKIETWLSERALLRGEYARSRRHAEEALRITEIHFGRHSLRYALTLSNLAIPLQELGEFDEALDCLADASDILAAFPSYAYGHAQLLANTANLLLVTGQYALMRDRLDVLASVITDHQLEQTEAGALALQLRSSLDRIEGNLGQARVHAAQGLQIMQTLFGEKHHRTADARAALAYVELEAGDHSQARRLAERALEANVTVPSERGQARFILARALWEPADASTADRTQAIELARSAKADYALAPSTALDAANVHGWLEQHDPGFSPDTEPQ